MAQLNARFSLRNDTAANWTSANPVLIAGEFGVEVDTGKFKIGDGTKNWADLKYAGADETALKQLINDAEDKATVLTRTADKTDADMLATITDPSQGDIAVVKVLLDGTTDKYSHTGYVYDADVWKALDGNYSAENVYFEDDITVTEKVGTISLTNGSGTLKLKGKNVAQGFQTLLAQEKNPSTTQPTATLSSNNIKAYEVGTSVAVAYSFSTNPGSYTYGPATGVTFSGYSATFNSETKTGVSGTFTAVTVGDDTSLAITGSCSSTEGAIPKTNLGSDYAAGQIKAKTYTPSVATKLTGFRKMFYGTFTNKNDMTSATIRALAKSEASASKTVSVSVPVGALRVAIAVPSGKKVTKVLDVNGLNAEITSAFSQTSVDVEGANGYTAKAYTVFYTDFAAANDKANTYTVTIG